MKNPNQLLVAQNCRMGILNLPGFSSDAEIKLSTLSTAITNPAEFATTLNAAHGAKSFALAIPKQSPGELAGVSVWTFSTASFHGGSMTLKAVNKYPAAVNATIEIRTTAGATLMSFLYYPQKIEFSLFIVSIFRGRYKRISQYFHILDNSWFLNSALSTFAAQ